MNIYKQNQKILLELESLKLLIASSSGDDTWDRDITYTMKNGTTVTVGIGKKGTRMEAKNKKSTETSSSFQDQEIITVEEFEDVDTLIKEGTKHIEQVMETPEIKQSVFGQMNFGVFKESLRETSKNLQENWKNSGLATFSSNLLQQAQDQLEKIPYEDIGGYIKSSEFARSMAVAGMGVLVSLCTPLMLPMMIVPPVALMIAPAIGLMKGKDNNVILGKPKQKFLDTTILKDMKTKNIDPNSPIGKNFCLMPKNYYME